MSWYSTTYKWRAAITVDNVSSPSSSPDVDLVIPPDFVEFWENIDTSGHVVRFTNWDGETLWAHQRVAWDHATRSATFRIDGSNAPNGMFNIWMFWADTGAADSSTTVTSSNAKNGYIETRCPGRMAVVLPAVRAEPGSTTPRASWAKDSASVEWVWWDVTDQLDGRCVPYQGARENEEIKTAEVGSEQGGSDVGGNYTTAETRIKWMSARRRTLVGVEYTGGTSGQTYTDTLKITTSAGRTLVWSATRRVQDPTEP